MQIHTTKDFNGNTLYYIHQYNDRGQLTPVFLDGYAPGSDVCIDMTDGSIQITEG